jgi:mannosyltransferase
VITSLAGSHTRRALGRLNLRYIEFGLVVAISLVGACLRFYKLGEWSFWIDELYTIGRAQAHTSWAALLDLWWRPTPSLWLTGWVLSQTGVSEASARFVPALLGSLTAPVLYMPTRRVWGPGVALIAALLLTVSPWHIFWSQNARFYSSLMLLYALAGFAFYVALEDDRPISIAVFYGLLWLAIGERFVALLLIPTVGVYLLLLAVLPLEKPRGWRPRTLMLLLAPGALVGTADLVVHVMGGDSYFAGALELAYGLRIDDPLRLALFIMQNLGYPLTALALCGGVYAVACRSRAGIWALVGATVPVGLLLILNPFVFTKDRYAFVTLPCWITLAALAIKTLAARTRESERWLVIGVLAMLLADAGGAGLLYYTANQGNRLDWRAAFSLARLDQQPGDRYVAYWPEFGDYYLGQAVLPWSKVTRGDVEDSGHRYWFFLDSETIWQNSTMKDWVERHAELIDVRYLRTVEDISMRIYRYDPRPSTSGH